MMVFAFLLVISIYALANFYIVKRIYPAVNFIENPIYSKGFLAIYIILAIILAGRFLCSFMNINKTIKKTINIISSYFMGIFVYMFLFLVIGDILVLISILTRITSLNYINEIRPFISIISILIALILSIIAIFNAKETNEVFYSISTNKELKEKIKITFISDVHLGAVGSEKRLKTIVEKINSQNSDVVLIAGDFFDTDFSTINNPDKAIELLKNIKSKYGVYACLGNHDAGKTFDEMNDFLKKSNIRLLNDEFVEIDNKFIVFGRLDASPIGVQGNLKRNLLKNLNFNNKNKLPVIVMEHNPMRINEYNGDIDLIVAGHTHKGQIWPGNIITSKMYAVDYGYYRKDEDSPQVVVSSGAGIWGMPMRLGSKCEIVNINLK